MLIILFASVTEGDLHLRDFISLKMQHMQANSHITCSSCHQILGFIRHSAAVFGYLYCKECVKAQKFHPHHNFIETWDKDIFAEPLFDFCLEGSDGGIVRSHKAVLAGKSEVFKAMITSGMSESTSGKVKIEDMTAPELRPLVNFLYTGRVGQRSLECYAVSLYKASHKYRLPLLMDICEHFLQSNVYRDVHGTFKVALDYEVDSLQNAVLPYIFSEGFVESNSPPVVVKTFRGASTFDCFIDYRRKYFKTISYLMELSLYRVADHLSFEAYNLKDQSAEGLKKTTVEDMQRLYKDDGLFLCDKEHEESLNECDATEMQP